MARSPPATIAVAVQGDFAWALDPCADGIEVATKPDARKIDAAADIRAAQQDRTANLQSAGIKGNAARRGDRYAVDLDVAADARPGEADFSGYSRAAQGETPTRFETIGLQSGQSRAVQKEIVDNGGTQHR